MSPEERDGRSDAVDEYWRRLNRLTDDHDVPAATARKLLAKENPALVARAGLAPRKLKEAPYKELFDVKAFALSRASGMKESDARVRLRFEMRALWDAGYAADPEKRFIAAAEYESLVSECDLATGFRLAARHLPDLARRLSLKGLR